MAVSVWLTDTDTLVVWLVVWDILAEGVSVAEILSLWLCVPGTDMVGVPAAVGVRVMPGVADELFITDSETTEVTDGLALWLGVTV